MALPRIRPRPDDVRVPHEVPRTGALASASAPVLDARQGSMQTVKVRQPQHSKLLQRSVEGAHSRPRTPANADEEPCPRRRIPGGQSLRRTHRTADAWEQSHFERCRRTERLLKRSMRQPTMLDVHSGHEDHFYSMLDSVRRSRLVLPLLKDEVADSTWKRPNKPPARRMSIKSAP